MKEATRLKKVAALSPRARALYERICQGHWYDGYERVPKSMAELEAAGLVCRGGRVKVLATAWVPVGTKPFKVEQYPAHCHPEKNT